MTDDAAASTAPMDVAPELLPTEPDPAEVEEA